MLSHKRDALNMLLVANKTYKDIKEMINYYNN